MVLYYAWNNFDEYVLCIVSTMNGIANSWLRFQVRYPKSNVLVWTSSSAVA